MRFLAVQRAFARRVRALERDLSAALENDVAALHHSRVASRRLREILPVLGLEFAPAGDPVAGKVKSRVRGVTRALGRVREMDVALGILDDLLRDNPEVTDVLGAARARVEEDRRSRHEQMLRALDDVQATTLVAQLSSLKERVGDGLAASRAALLRRRLGRRVDRLDAAIEAAGALYAIDRLHVVRIAVKQLRYVLELIHEFGRVPARRQVNRLKRFQDLLGRLHDLEFVAAYIRRQGGTGSGEFANETAQALRPLERETRELHARYLAGVADLVAVTVYCRDKIDRKLAEGPPPRRQAAGSIHGR